MNDSVEDPEGTVPVADQAAVQVHNVIAAPEETPFSVDGAVELERKMDLFLSDLVSECRRIARRHGADHVSPAYVRQALDYLITRKRRRIYGLAGTFGAIVLGAAVSGLLSAATAVPHDAPRLLASAGAGMAGIFAIALQFAAE